MRFLVLSVQSQERKFKNIKKNLRKQPVNYIATGLKSAEESDGEALKNRSDGK